MSLFVKLCGVRSTGDMQAAVDAGADAVGIVMSPSIRQVDWQTAAMLCNRKQNLVTVGVFYRPSADVVRRARDDVGFDLIQAETECLVGVDEIDVLPVVHDGPRFEKDIARARARANGGRVLVEGPGRGGSGSQPDWTRVAGLGRGHDLVLAGGLTASNVGRAIEIVGPGGVDVSSGIESSHGRKDPFLMRAFVEASRNADKEFAL